jgi:alpha-L-fucosidase 2
MARMQLLAFGLALLAQDTRLWYDEPAAAWTSALPVGNGRLGAMVFGGVPRERLQLNEDTLWAGQPETRDRAGAAQHLAEVRRLLFAGEVVAAQRLAQRELMGPEKNVSYQTLGDLVIDLEHTGEAEDYRRWLDLATGIAGVRYRVGATTFTREVFASAPAGAIVVRLAADTPGALAGTVRLSRESGAMIRARWHGSDAEGLAAPMAAISLSGVASMGAEQPGTKFFAYARISANGEDAGLELRDDAVVVAAADELRITISADGGRHDAHRGTVQSVNIGDAMERLIVQDSVHQPGGLEAHRATHVADHAALFGRVTLDLGGDPGAALIPTDQRLAAVRAGATDLGLEALYCQFGRYLLMGCSRPGTMPANLQGLWNEHLAAPWNADYHININVQMNYWPAEVLNLAECHTPLFHLIDGIARNGAVTAREVYGARGWVAHHTTDAHWFTAPIGNTVWGLWPFGGAWCTRHLYEHWAYGGDDSFARERAYPHLAGAARFFLDYLVEHPTTGQLVSGPSSSPENTYVLPDGQRADIAMGNTMDHMIVRDLFTNLLELADTLGIDDDLVAEVRVALPRLAPTRIGEDGRILEWAEPHHEAEPGHRHMSHLFGLHPGREITPRGTPELAAAARRSIEARLAHGGGHTGWSRAWLINFMARLGDGDAAHEHLRLLLAKSTLPNLFDDHPPFQIDGNFGGAAGIAEMLLQSHAGELHLLPALPAAWPNGRVTGLRARGGFEVDIEWRAGALTRTEVRSKLGRPLELRIGETRIGNTPLAGSSFTYIPER